MKVCAEMQKLRDWLDAYGIEWIDNSIQMDNDDWWIYRTQFNIGIHKVYVVNGLGFYGNDIGELDMWCKAIDPEPIGWLTAENVIEKLKELMK